MTGRSRLLAWGVFALTVAGLAGNVLLAVYGRSLPAQIGDWPTFLTVVLLIVSFALVGLLISLRFPRNAIGWICAGLAFVLAIPAGAYGSYAFKLHPPGIGATYAALVDNLAFPAFLVLLIFLVILFPDGRLPSPRWRLPTWAIGISCTLWVAAFAFSSDNLPNSFSWLHSPLALPGPAGFFFLVARVFGWFALAVGLLAAAVALVLRLIRSKGEARQQLKWLAAAGAFFALTWLTATVASTFGLNDLSNAIGAVTSPALFAFPIAIGLAIFRYGLYEIDVVLNRALVYGALAAFITTVYVGIVVGIGRLVGSGNRPSFALSIVATAVVAIAFQPVRERVQRFANRLVYGKRATPYEVMAGFADRMAGTLSVDDVLPQMAEAAARGVGAQAARVTLFLPDGSDRSTVWPSDATGGEFVRTLPISHGDERVGEISVREIPGQPITHGEDRLLADLAAQAGLVLHNVRLTAELQARLVDISAQAAELRASRQRIVAAQETERRRLGAEIRAGAQHELEATAEELDEVERLLGDDGAGAAARLEALTTETQRTLDGLRELARGIFPPLLADKGIVAALHAHARTTATSAVFDTSPELATTRFDAGVEAAVYFCCTEALRALDGPATVHLRASDGVLTFTIDGVAAANGHLEGVRDRVEALGGSVEEDAPGRLHGWVPARPVEAVR